MICTGNFLKDVTLPNDSGIGCRDYCIQSNGDCNGCERYEWTEWPEVVEEVCRVVNTLDIKFTKEAIEALINLVQFRGV